MTRRLRAEHYSWSVRVCRRAAVAVVASLRFGLENGVTGMWTSFLAEIRSRTSDAHYRPFMIGICQGQTELSSGSSRRRPCELDDSEQGADGKCKLLHHFLPGFAPNSL